MVKSLVRVRGVPAEVNFFLVAVSGIIRGRMAQRLHELIGRAMIDPDFLEELRRSPDAVLAEYELSDNERAAVRHALDRLGSASARHVHEFHNALLRRVAT
jgi:hypothetical protein